MRAPFRVAKQNTPREDRAFAASQRFQRRFLAAFERKFMAMVEAVRGELTEVRLANAVRTGNVQPLLDAVREHEALLAKQVDLRDLSFDASLELLQAQLAREKAKLEFESMLDQLGSGRRRAGFKFSFDLVNPRVAPWARENAARLVREVGDETRASLRDIVVRMTTDGVPPRIAAKEIREHVGLTERQSRAVSNRRAKLEAEGRPAAQVDRMTEAYSKKLLRYRSENIARTEIIRSQTAGQTIAWEAAADEGLIDRATVKRQWIAAVGSARTDDLCLALAELEPVGMGEPFVAEGLEFDAPPAHPSCRCTLALVT